MVSNEWECNWIKCTHGKRKWMNVSCDCSTIISIIITIKDDKEATNYKSHSYVQMKLLFSVCSKYLYIWRWWFTDYVCSTAITLSKKLYIYILFYDSKYRTLFIRIDANKEKTSYTQKLITDTFKGNKPDEREVWWCFSQ